MMWPFRRLGARTRRSTASPAEAQPCAALTQVIDSDDKLIPMFLASYSSLFTNALAGWNAGDIGVCYDPSGCDIGRRNGREGEPAESPSDSQFLLSCRDQPVDRARGVGRL